MQILYYTWAALGEVLYGGKFSEGVSKFSAGRYFGRATRIKTKPTKKTQQKAVCVELRCINSGMRYIQKSRAEVFAVPAWGLINE